MTIKTYALIAATIASTASMASANTYFEHGLDLDSSDVLELGLITAEGAGVVEIYDYRTGTQGALLGSEPLHAGANTDVRVPTGFPASSDVLAVVKVGGQIVATKTFDIDAN